MSVLTTDYKKMLWQDLRGVAHDRGVIIKHKKRVEIEHELILMDEGVDPTVPDAGVSPTSINPPDNPTDQSNWFRYPSPGIKTRFRAEQYTCDLIHIKDGNSHPPCIVANVERLGPVLQHSSVKTILPFRLYSKLIVDAFNTGV